MSSAAIRPPTAGDGLTPAEVEQHRADLRALEADPRTAGSANRPAWLVRRVLADARSAR